jgi:HEAT repeat protein
MFERLKVSWHLRKLHSGNPSEKIDAIEALGKSRNPRAAIPLIETLRSFTEYKRSAATALGELGDSRAIEPLVEALKDPDENLRTLAGWSLRKLGWRPHSAEERAVYAVALEDFEACVAEGAAAVEPLIFALDGSNHVRMDAAKALVKLADASAVAPLLKAYKDAQKRFRTANSSSSRSSKSEVDSAMNASLAVHHALLDLANQRVGDVALFLAALEDPDKEVQSLAASALGKLRDPRVVEPLIAFMRQSRDPWRRSVAAKALGDLNDSAAVKPLVDSLSDASKYMRKDAAEALQALGWKPSTGEEKAVYAIARDDFKACVREGAAAVEPLCAVLQDSDDDVRTAAVHGLGTIGHLGGRRVVAELIKRLQDNSPEVRKEAARALAPLKNAEALDPLIAALDDHVAEVAWEAVGALRKLGGERAIDALLQKSGSNYVARDILRDLGDAALTNALEHSNSSVRRAVIELLRERGDTGVVGLATTMLKDPDAGVRAYAVQTLAQLVGSQAIDQISDMLRDVDDRVRWTAVLHLTTTFFAGPRAIEALSTVLDDREFDVRYMAAKAVVASGTFDPRAIASILGALRSRDKSVLEESRGLLLALLKSHLGQLDTSQLRVVAELPSKLYFDYYAEDRCGNPTVETQGSTGTSELRQVARQEIIRRENAPSRRPSLATPPSAIVVECACGQKFRVKAEYAGRRAKCMKCGVRLMIPGEEPN